MEALSFIYDDGGREAAGFKGHTGDCVVRAIAIATDTPYADVYADLHAAALGNKRYMAKLTARHGEAGAKRRASPRAGVPRHLYDPYLAKLGWIWTPTMAIGQGTKVHMRKNELPDGRLIVRLTHHLSVVIDGVIHDTGDPSRNGTRCVFGYWQPATSA